MEPKLYTFTMPVQIRVKATFPSNARNAVLRVLAAAELAGEILDFAAGEAKAT